jgi:hypothetical protein
MLTVTLFYYVSLTVKILILQLQYCVPSLDLTDIRCNVLLGKKCYYSSFVKQRYYNAFEMLFKRSTCNEMLSKQYRNGPLATKR